MANTGELLISNKGGVYLIKVSGRATFDCAPPLRNLAKSLESEVFTEIKIDLSDCTWMDSTFMGILAMLGLRSKKINAGISICNASEQNIALLCGLGLKKLFAFVNEAFDAPAEGTDAWSDKESGGVAGSARTVLDAHKTLMDVDEQNVKKFEKVVDMVQKDIDRLNNADN